MTTNDPAPARPASVERVQAQAKAAEREVGEVERLRAELEAARAKAFQDYVIQNAAIAALHDERDKLKAELADADLLLGDSWQETVAIARGEAGVETALRIQCTKLAGDLAVERQRIDVALKLIESSVRYDTMSLATAESLREVLQQE